MADKIFAAGMIAKAPRDNAPSFVKASIAIRVSEFITFLNAQDHNGWVNIDIKESAGGKWYAELDTFKKTGMTENPAKPSSPGIDYPKDDIRPEDIPF